MANYRNKRLPNLVSLTKALADEGRLRVLMTLRQGELCVCQITELMGLSPSTVSKHLSILTQAGLVERRKRGRWVFYRLPGKGAPAPQRGAVGWVASALGEDPQVLDDKKRIEEITKIPPEILCGRKRRR